MTYNDYNPIIHRIHAAHHAESYIPHHNESNIPHHAESYVSHLFVCALTHDMITLAMLLMLYCGDIHEVCIRLYLATTYHAQHLHLNLI